MNWIYFSSPSPYIILHDPEAWKDIDFPFDSRTSNMTAIYRGWKDKREIREQMCNQNGGF